MDFSKKKVVKDRLSSSFSGGDPDAQVIVFRFWELDCQSPEIELQAYILKWLEPAVQKPTLKYQLHEITGGILSRFEKLMTMISQYPDKKQSVLHQLAASSIQLHDEPITVIVRQVQSQVNSRINEAGQERVD